MPVAAILLAAGSSSRLGRPKQLVVFHGETLLERAMRLAQESGAASVVTVLGAFFHEISAVIPQGSSIRVLNDRWEQGIATSIHAGLRALDAVAPESQGILILTCDQLRLTADHLRALTGVFDARPEPSIIASSYANTIGVPAIFPRCAYPHLLKLRGDQGARKLLLDPPCPLHSIELAGGEVDIDSPDDLAHLHGYAK